MPVFSVVVSIAALVGFLLAAFAYRDTGRLFKQIRELKAEIVYLRGELGSGVRPKSKPVYYDYDGLPLRPSAGV